MRFNINCPLWELRSGFYFRCYRSKLNPILHELNCETYYLSRKQLRNKLYVAWKMEPTYSYNLSLWQTWGKKSCFWALWDRGSIFFSFVGHMVTITLLWGPHVILEAFYKFAKATVSFFLSVCLSNVLSCCPHGTTRLSLGGFSRNFILNIFIESVEKI